MAFSVEGKNEMLNAFTSGGLYVSVHNADPGPTGANEIAGTTRQAISHATAAGGVAAQTSSPSVPGIPSAETVAYLGLWKHVSSTSQTYWRGKQAVTPFTGTGTTWSYPVTAGTLDLNQLPSA